VSGPRRGATDHFVAFEILDGTRCSVSLKIRRAREGGFLCAKTTRPSNVSLDEMRAVWDTNVFGVLAVYQAMLPLLRKTPGARIVNVSSGVGSLTANSDPLRHVLFLSLQALELRGSRTE
jgi:NAD(P)-dependent dehydrogenase (short-subunit alcohol dehydrogenase family)